MGLSHSGRRILSVSAAFLLAMASPSDAQTQPQRPLSLRVVVYDYAAVAPAEFERARRVGSDLFGEIGVDTIWLSIPEFTQQLPLGDAERRAYVAGVIQVKLVMPAMHKALGLTHNALGAAHPATRVVWISIERVRQSARAARVEFGDALGYVIGHEMGHVLLRVSTHSVTGLMGEFADLEILGHNRLSFLDQEAALIRANLAAIRLAGLPR